MEHKDTKAQSWKFWKRWIGTEQERDQETQDAPPSPSTPPTSSTEDIQQERDQDTQKQTLNHINASTSSTTIEEIDRLKEELDALRPLPSDVVGRIEQKLRIESNYHSNAIEGNSLTLGETRSLILHGLTAHGKPMRDHLDIEGHDEAVKAIEDAIKRNESLNEIFIRNLHKVLLKEPYEIDAITPDGQPTKRLITIGDYKTQPNNVRTSTGEIYHYTLPEHVKPAMGDLIDWYRRQEDEGEHPIVIAATFHYRFVHIHPFDDGNGRIARLLMNMILIRHGYTVAIIPIQERGRYIDSLEQADKSEDLAEFITYIAECCKYALNLHLKAARGEDIEDVEDIDKEIALFKRSLQKDPGETIQAREYADKVLYPLFHHCKEKLEQFSDMFKRFIIPLDDSSVRKADHQISNFSLSKDKSDAWPENALFVSTNLEFLLYGYQAKQGSSFSLRINNEADSNGSVWKFSSSDLNYDKEYTGRDVEVLKKIFNEMIRLMMKKLSENPEDREAEG